MVFNAGRVMTPEMGCSRRPRRAIFFNAARFSMKFDAVSKVSIENTGLN